MDEEQGHDPRPRPRQITIDVPATESEPSTRPTTRRALSRGSTSTRSSPFTPLSLFRSPFTPHMPRRISNLSETTPLRHMAEYFILPTEDSVYSYFLMIPPIEQRRTKRYMTPLIIFAGVLVLVNFVMQYGLLVVVGKHIMEKHIEWVSSITHLQYAWYHVIPMRYNLPPSRCRGKHSAVCAEHGDGISCAPPVMHVLTDWSLLDFNGDGVWSRVEAKDQKLRDTVQCDYDVDLLSLYDMTAQHLNQSDTLKGRRDAALFSGEGVHKAYFNWYLHKPLLCQYGDPDMCGLLFKRGFFDEALQQRSSAEFTSTATALKYCTRILQRECFDILPTTYSVWRSVSNTQCGDKVFGKSSYRNPRDTESDDNGGAATPMLTVDFRTYMTYASTRGLPFKIFLNILLVAFLSVMSLEFRLIFKTLMWTVTFPKDDLAGKDGHVVSRQAVVIVTKQQERDGFKEDDAADDAIPPTPEATQKAIFAVRTDHRVAVLVVTLLRLLLWCYLLWSGILFLTGKPRYLALIFDALSLVFIFEIDELLYRTMLRVELQNDHGCIDDMRVPTVHRGLMTGIGAVVGDTLQFMCVLVFASVVVWTYYNTELNPLIDALQCLCMTDGPRCHAAQTFPKSWWDNYWSSTLPAANLIIDQLRS